MKQKLEKATILLLLTAISFCSVFVMLFYYQPNQNALGALASVCMDAVCMLIVLVLVVNLLLEKKQIDLTTKLFLCLMLGTMWALFLDFLTWTSDGSLDFNNMTYVYTVGSLCMGSILGALFVLYLGNYMYDVYDLKSAQKHSRICAIFNVIAFIITFTLAITKTAFTFNNGHYETGALYDLVTAIPVLTLVYMTAYSIRYIKIIGIHDFIAVIGYILIMIAGALIEGEFSIGTTYVAITVADIFIFVMLQNKLIDKEKQNAEKWMKKSNTDDLTGFFNRHAYEEEIKNLEKNGIPDNFIYVSMDINGLKVVNDTLGHTAGDELIVGACECMKKCFSSYGKLYRIGGDEFAAFIYASDSEMESIKKNLQETSEMWEGEYNKSLTISSGFVTRQESLNMTLHQAAVIADKKMYADKSNYYRKKGVDRRGQRDAHVALCALYTKILKINISDNTYQIINTDTNEQVKEMGFSENFSEWVTGFVETEMVHKEDSKDFLAKINIEYLSNYFKNNKDGIRIFYRRKYNDTYKQTIMEIIPANDYSDESQTLFLYVKEIDR